MAVRKYPATYEDLRAVRDTMVAEVIDGELIAAPRGRRGEPTSRSDHF